MTPPFAAFFVGEEMRKNEPMDIKRDALSLYEKVSQSIAGEDVVWGSAAYDAKRRYENTREAFMAARCDMGAFDNVFATVLKHEGEYSDEEFREEYASFFPYEVPPPEAWRAAMFASAYLVDTNTRAVKRIGLPIFLPEGADAYYGWQVDAGTIELLMGTSDYRVCGVTREFDDRVFFTAEQLEIGSEGIFATIGLRRHVVGRAIIVGYRVASNEYYDAPLELANEISFYRGKLTGYGDLEYLSNTIRTRIVEVLED